jgi:predicted permease
MVAAITLVLVLIALGQLSGRLRLLPEGSAELLHRFVLLICLPALVIVQVRQLEFDPALSLLMLVPWVWALLAIVLVKLLRKPLNLSREVEGCLLITLPLGNTAFLGYPMVESLLGPSALPAAVVYDQLGSFLILSTVGVTLAAIYRTGQRPPWQSLLWRVITFPAFVGLLIGLLPIEWPAPLLAVLERLAACLVPLVLFAIGMQLRFRLPAGQGRGLALGLALKLGGGALCAFLLASAFAAPTAVRDVAVLQAAMPVMVTGAALAIEAKQAPELASGLAGVGVLLALLWLPLLAWWL